MTEKTSYKVMLFVDNDGYIDGWQQEFFDGTNWVTPFDTTNAIDLTQSEIDSIVLGATRLVDGKPEVDPSKLNEADASQQQSTPTLEQSMINALGLQVAQLRAELANKNGDGASV